MPLPSDSPITNNVSIFTQHFHNCPSDEARINCVRNTDIETRVRAAMHNAEVDQFMYHKDLVIPWNIALGDADALQALETGYTFHIKQQSNVCSFDLFKGVFYMDEAYKVISQQEPPLVTKQALSLIQKAEQCNYFPAMSFLNKILNEIDIKQGNFQSDIHVKKALNRLNRCALLYGSPGYLELAQYHMEQAACYQTTGKQDCTQLALLSALVALHVANTIENDCAIPIYNAYGEDGMPGDEIFRMQSLLTQQCKEPGLAINMANQEATNWQANNSDLCEAITTTCRI